MHTCMYMQEFQRIFNIGGVKTLLAVVKKRVALQVTCQENIQDSHHGKPADTWGYTHRQVHFVS